MLCQGIAIAINGQRAESCRHCKLPHLSIPGPALACGGAKAPASVRGVARKSNTSERAVSGASSSPVAAVPRRLRVLGPPTAPMVPAAARSSLPRALPQALCCAASKPSSSAALSPPAPPLPGAGVCRSSNTSRGVNPPALAPAAGVSRAWGQAEGGRRAGRATVRRIGWALLYCSAMLGPMPAHQDLHHSYAPHWPWTCIKGNHVNNITVPAPPPRCPAWRAWLQSRPAAARPRRLPPHLPPAVQAAGSPVLGRHSPAAKEDGCRAAGLQLAMLWAGCGPKGRG